MKKLNSKRIIYSIVSTIISISLFSCVGTFYVVRHGEKLNNNDDTPLSSFGLQRAETLSDSLSSKGIDSIFASTKLRSQQTAQPLAQRIHKQVKIYGLDTIAIFNQKIKKLKKSVLIVSHSNLIPELIQTLSDQTIPPIAENDFDNYYKVTIKKSWTGQITKSLVISRYGVITP